MSSDSLPSSPMSRAANVMRDVLRDAMPRSAIDLVRDVLRAALSAPISQEDAEAALHWLRTTGEIVETPTRRLRLAR